MGPRNSTSNTTTSLRHRVRAATADELDRVPWWPLLDAPQRSEALQQRFAELHQQLRRNTARTATDAIAQITGQA